MVIPLGGGGMGGQNSLLGGGGGGGVDQSFPPGLEGQIRSIKFWVQTIVACLIGSLVFGSLLQEKNLTFVGLLLNDLNVILVVVIGSFLLKDNQAIPGCYECLTKVFSVCAGCQTGMGCLNSFMMLSAINPIINILINPDIYYVFSHLQKVADPQAWPNSLWGYSFICFSISTLGMYASQITASVAAYKAFKEMSNSGFEQSGGDWAQQPGGNGGGGGGYFGGGGGRPGAGDGGAPPPSNEPSARRPASGIQAFQGQGHRLGS